MGMLSAGPKYGAVGRTTTIEIESLIVKWSPQNG